MTNALLNYTLHLADDALILGHRNSEWCGHGPVLEQDIAITNISLDLIGQARNLYQHAAELINKSQDQQANEDTLAYLRGDKEFMNCLLVEQPNGDWAKTILRQFFFSVYQFHLFQQLQGSTWDQRLAAIAEKSLKEVTYHVRWSAEWVVRLGDGTDESRHRILQAGDDLWMYTGELWAPAEYETQISKDGLKISFDDIKTQWQEQVKEVFSEAGIPTMQNTFMKTGGKQGKHTEHLGHVLVELQNLQRTYPNSEW